MDGVAYVGDTQGRLWAARLDGSPLTLPPATTINELPDAFGRALSIAGNTLAVGAPDFSGASIMDGQVTIWESAEPRGGEWSLAQTINSPSPSFSGWFGSDVAMADGLLAIVEAGRDLSRSDRGSSAQIHVYQYLGGTWQPRQTLDHPYAHSIAVRSNLLVVGSSTNLAIFNMIDGPDGASAVLATNIPSALLTDSVYEPTAQVALHGDTICYGLCGDFSRYGGPGQVNIYERNTNGIWTLVTRLSGLRPAAFGFAVAVKNDWVAVGAPREDRGARQAGAVYLYQRTPNGYSIRQTVLAPCPEPEGNFGASVALGESTLIVGASRVVNGHGAVFVYERDSTSWAFKGRVEPPAGALSEFGTRVAHAETWLAAGCLTSFDSTNLAERVAIRRLPEDITLPSLTITAQPISHTISPGGRVELTVTPSGKGPFSYQWKRVSTNVGSARDLTFDPLLPEHVTGPYTVTVTAPGACAESASAVLTLLSMSGQGQLSIAGPQLQPYQLDYIDALGDSNQWATLTNFTLPGSPYIFEDLSATTHRFYRLLPIP